MHSVTLDQILTEEEIVRVIALWHASHDGSHIDFVRMVEREFILPNLDRINRATGQDNHPLYLAYAIDHVLHMASVTRERK